MANKMLNLLSGVNHSMASMDSISSEYDKFRSCVSLQKVIVDDDCSKVWTLYDCGPRSVASPLIFLPPVSGTAHIFYGQMLFLSSKGYRVIALQYPTYWTLREFLNGFLKLLDHMMLDRVHIFGASLGGFLAQKFAESTSVCPRVASLILCNSFADTSIFNHTESAQMFWLMPATVLKKLVMGNNSLHTFSKDQRVLNAIEFMSHQLNTLTQTELASRLTLNCINCYVEPQLLHCLDITIIDVFDYCALSQTVREELYKLYPNAKRAHLKTGGNFPYLSRSDEVNMHLIIHLRNFKNTKYSACVDDIEIASAVTSDNNER